MALTYTHIATTTVASPSHTVTFTNITQDYTDLLVVYSLRSDYGFVVHEGQFIFNSVTSGYENILLQGDGTNTGSARNTGDPASTWALVMNGSAATGNAFSNGELYISNYSSASVAKSWGNRGVAENNATQGTVWLQSGTNTSTTAAITSLTFYAWQTFINFVAGSRFSLYGVKNTV